MEETDKKSVWLIGEVTAQLPERLPTIRDVMRVYYNYRLVKLESKKESVNLVVKDLIAHWNSFDVAAIAPQDIVRKINKIVDQHDSYKKSMHRDTDTQRHNERKFLNLLNERFVMEPKPNYHRNKKEKEQSVKCEALNQLDVNSNTDFEMNDEVQADFDDDKDSQNESIEIDEESSNKNDEDFELSLTKYQLSKFSSGKATKNPGVIHKIINSPDVSSALDRTGITSPKFTILCAAIAGAVGEALSDCTLSESTCYRRRKSHRDQIVTVIKDDFKSSLVSNVVLHWDGKKLRDTTNDSIALRNKKVERLAVVVSGPDFEKIITIAKTEDGTGLVIADTVFEHVVDWDLLDKIIGICTDTTATNTGRTNGSVILFQILLERNVLYFACRHHVLELLIGSIFVALFGESTGPSPDMFENFRRDWHAIDQASFQPFDIKIFKENAYMSTLKDDVIRYVKNILATKDKKFVPKGDYLEMMELCLIILGEKIPNYKFHVPHACSHARWMAKIIYSMKMYLFRKQLNFSRAEVRKLKDICLFTCLVYVKNWIMCCIPSNAPHNDLLLMKELGRYSVVNSMISKNAIHKFDQHLWYLGCELVVLSLFSDKVQDNVKRRMFDKMKTLDNGQWTERNLRLMDSTDIFERNLDDLVSSSSMIALKSLKLDIQFMFDYDVSEWKTLASYKEAKSLVDSLQVVNDCAERTLKLMTDFNESLTTKEPEKQNAIQVIEDNRKRIPNTKKSVLSVYKKHRFE